MALLTEGGVNAPEAAVTTACAAVATKVSSHVNQTVAKSRPRARSRYDWPATEKFSNFNPVRGVLFLATIRLDR